MYLKTSICCCKCGVIRGKKMTNPKKRLISYFGDQHRTMSPQVITPLINQQIEKLISLLSLSEPVI